MKVITRPCCLFFPESLKLGLGSSSSEGALGCLVSQHCSKEGPQAEGLDDRDLLSHGVEADIQDQVLFLKLSSSSASRGLLAIFDIPWLIKHTSGVITMF